MVHMESASPEWPGSSNMQFLATRREVVDNKRKKNILSAAKQEKLEARRLKDRCLHRRFGGKSAKEASGAAMVAAAMGQLLHTIASGHDLPIPLVNTAYWPCMMPEHWDASDHQYRTPVREKLKQSLREKECDYLYPLIQPAELWFALQGVT